MQKPTHEILYELPELSTRFLRKPALHRVAGSFQESSPGMLAIACYFRSKEQSVVEELQFIEPVANSVYSLFAVPSFASIAYDKVIEFHDSGWLQEIRTRVSSRPSGIDPSGLRHLALMFDDGPYYEFICREFAHVSKPG